MIITQKNNDTKKKSVFYSNCLQNGKSTYKVKQKLYYGTIGKYDVSVT